MAVADLMVTACSRRGGEGENGRRIVATAAPPPGIAIKNSMDALVVWGTDRRLLACGRWQINAQVGKPRSWLPEAETMSLRESEPCRWYP